MFRTILVPLDGSAFSEQALPLASSLCRRSGAALDLVRVHVLYSLKEPSFSWIPGYDQDLETDGQEQEQLYLNGTAQYLKTISGVTVNSTVVNGLTEEGILSQVRRVQPDLIVMAHRELSPVSRFFVGNVGDELIRKSSVPVVLVGPRDPPPALIPEPVLENVIICLDGSPLAEKAIEPALDLAIAMEASCTLLQVMELDTDPPRETKADAEMYLKGMREKLYPRFQEIQSRLVIAHDAAEGILGEARESAHSLIALASHGRGGISRLVMGSVAGKVIRGAAGPVLVYRPPG